MNYHWPLIGHDNIRTYFTHAFGSGRVHHAYLFEGPEHIGKTTFARMLANTLLCESETTIPCGSCRSCTAFIHGVHPDVAMLLKGEEDHVSIEQVREYIITLRTRPLLGIRRIGIIEEASRLTLEAANALLKTLEEPSASVVLFLITHTDVLPTIASRCQRIKFGFVSDRAISLRVGATGYQDELMAYAAGRPGLALQYADPQMFQEYADEFHELEHIVAQNESKQMLWIAERFGSLGNASERRDLTRRLITTLQAVLRKDLPTRPGGGTYLKRTIHAGQYLNANVDPRSIWEYIFFE